MHGQLALLGGLCKALRQALEKLANHPANQPRFAIPLGDQVGLGKQVALGRVCLDFKLRKQLRIMSGSHKALGTPQPLGLDPRSDLLKG